MTEQLMMLPRHVLDDARKIARKRGHAGVPGRGPDGETCKTCEHIAYVQWSKRYYKCKLMEKSWTSGGGTDIRLRDPACEFWEPQKND